MKSNVGTFDQKHLVYLTEILSLVRGKRDLEPNLISAEFWSMFLQFYIELGNRKSSTEINDWISISVRRTLSHSSIFLPKSFRWWYFIDPSNTNSDPYCWWFMLLCVRLTHSVNTLCTDESLPHQKNLNGFINQTVYFSKKIPRQISQSEFSFNSKTSKRICISSFFLIAGYSQQ